MSLYGKTRIVAVAINASQMAATAAMKKPYRKQVFWRYSTKIDECALRSAAP